MNHVSVSCLSSCVVYYEVFLYWSKWSPLVRRGVKMQSLLCWIEQKQVTLIRAQAGVKNTIRKLNQSIIRSGNNHVMHVVLFALLLFFILYMWSKMFKR